MTDQAAVCVTWEILVEAPHPVSPDSFHSFATALMDALIDLEECNPEVVDATVSSDAGKHQLTVDMMVLTADPADAAYISSGFVRTGLHAVGSNTARWPKVQKMESTTEKARVLA